MTPPLWVTLFKVVVVFGMLLVGTALLIWAERRIVALMQSRVGPNRAGPAGILQSFADGIKLFFKEDITPAAVDRPVYMLAPLISVIVAFLAFATVPFGGTVTLFGETFTLQLADVNVGVLWFLAMGSINVYGIVLAGWASGSGYPLLGGVRSSAQMISYEITQGLAVASVFIWAGTLSTSQIVAQQAGPGLVNGVPNWFVIPQFVAFVLFFLAVVAETQRPPFDLPEAEGELVAGFHTEYSGMRFAMFFLAEFMNVITVSAVTVTLFFGGPSGPILIKAGWIAWFWPLLWFSLKTFTFVLVFITLRAALPRMKYDALMRLGWKLLLPIGLVWVMVSAVFVILNEQVEAKTRNTVYVAGTVVLVVVFLFAGEVNRFRLRTGHSVVSETRNPVVSETRNQQEEVKA